MSDNLPRLRHPGAWRIEDTTDQHEGAVEAVGLVAEGLPVAQFVDQECEVARLLVSFPDWIAAHDQWKAEAEIARGDAEHWKARAEKAQAEVAHLQSVLDGISDPHHVVDIRATDYGLQHPPACRPDLLACPIHQAMEDLGGPPMPAGRYRVGMNGNGSLAFAPIEEAA